MEHFFIKFSPDGFILGLLGLSLAFYFLRGILRIMDKDLNGNDND